MKKVKVKINGNWVETVGLNNKYNDAPVGAGQHLVTFYDFNGKVLKRQRVATGGDATAPLTPTHEFLTFAEWNNPFTNVQSDIDTGAIYNTTDGCTYLFYTLTPVTGLTPTLYFSKSTTSLMTITRNDGTTWTSTTSGNQNITLNHTTAGNYWIKIDNSAGGTWTAGQGATTTTLFEGYENILTKVYFGNYVIVNTYFIHNNNSCINISFGSYVSIAALFLASSRVKFVSLGNNTFSSNSMFSSCVVNKVVFYKGLTAIPINTFQFNTNEIITKLILPSTLTSIGASAFANQQILIYIFNSTTPPTLANINAFTGINPICKIYVPDASVAAYKTTMNWNQFASYIYPLSEKPQSDE